MLKKKHPGWKLFQNVYLAKSNIRPWFIEYTLRDDVLIKDASKAYQSGLSFRSENGKLFLQTSLEVVYVTHDGVMLSLRQVEGYDLGNPELEIAPGQQELMEQLGISVSKMNTTYGEINLIVMRQDRSYSASASFDHDRKHLAVRCEGARSAKAARHWVQRFVDSLEQVADRP